ncbi:MAG: hypothetical protein WCO00_09900 [Rhodospirillaceae bacterium]
MAANPDTLSLISALVPGLRHTQFQHTLEVLALAVFAALLASGLSVFLLYCVEYFISKERSSFEAVNKINRRVPALKTLMWRHEKLKQTLGEANGKLNTEFRRYEKAGRVLGQLKRREFIKVRFANEPNDQLPCFAAYVYNDFVRKYVAKGQHYPLLDDVWATAQLVEVWAETPEKAEIEITRKYAKVFGFYMTNLEKVNPLSQSVLSEPEEEAAPVRAGAGQ